MSTQEVLNDPMIQWMMDDIGVDTQKYSPVIDSYLKTVRKIESSDLPFRRNKNNTAHGYYQFKNTKSVPTLQEAIDAALLYYRKAGADAPEALVEENNKPEAEQNANNLDKDLQSILFLSNLYRKKDSNSILLRTFTGDAEAGRRVYDVLHHTQGLTDKDTIAVADTTFRGYTKFLEKFDVPVLGEEQVGTDFEPRLESELASGQMKDLAPKVKELMPSLLETLEEVEVPKRSGRFPEVSVDAQRRSGAEILDEVSVDARRVDPTPPPLPELQEVNVPSREPVAIPPTSEPRLESELAATQMAAMQPRAPAEVTVPQRAGRFPEVTVDAQRRSGAEILNEASVPSRKLVDLAPRVKELLPQLEEVAVTAQRVSGEIAKPAIAPAAAEAYKKLQELDAQRYGGLLREFSEGATFGLMGEFAAGIKAATSDTPYEYALAEYELDREKFKREDPAAAAFSIPAEIAGGLPTGSFLYKGLTKIGVKSIPQAGAIEGGIYMGAQGEGDADDRLLQAGGGAAFGAAFARLFQGLADSTMGKLAKTPEELFEMQAQANAKAIKEAKINRPTADITDDELATQLIIRDTEFLAEAVGRKGMAVEETGSMFTRMRDYAIDMGIDMKTFNRVYKNKQIKEIYSLVYERGTRTPEQLNVLRQELLDRTASFILRDGAKTVPEAQSIVGRYRTFISPLSTLAETMVGRAFADRMVRAMNIVTRRTVDLDRMWKGMEPFRELAQNRAFNDAMHDAVNAANIGEEAAGKALQRAMNMAKAKIGKGADVRLQQFLDDNYKFSERYRKEVTTGILSKVWMHSTPTLIARDVGLKRPTAAGKAKDAAAKVRSRKTMKEWRLAQEKKPAEKQLDMANIFDSHWAWQRQTLTRMELGHQLGIRVHGKPMQAMSDSKLKKRKASKKALKEGATPIEATAKFEEGGTLKLFDADIIEESLRLQGYTPAQIKNAISILDNVGVDANKAMAGELDIIRSLGYVGTIANPYGALMNIHDLFNASFELGIGNVLRAVFSNNGIRFSADDMGLARQVFGEFVRKARRGESRTGNAFIERLVEGSADLLDWSMKWSGFAGLDKFGKNKIMGASFNKAKEDIANGSFDSKWQYSFSRGELDQLKRDIAANADTELVRDLVMFDLFKLQPINAAAQTAYGLANPNARLFYMLKGFAVKQLDLLERRIVGEWKKGNKEQALINAGKYLVISGGGYGVVNEARQVIKGEAPDPEEAAVSAFYQVGSVLTLGAMGANDYGYDRFFDNPMEAMITNIFPPLTATLPAAVMEDLADAVRKGDPYPDEVIYAIPIVGKTLEGVFK